MKFVIWILKNLKINLMCFIEKESISCVKKNSFPIYFFTLIIKLRPEVRNLEKKNSLKFESENS